MKQAEPNRVVLPIVEELEPRIAPISAQGLDAIAAHRPFNAPPDDAPPPIARSR